MSLRRRVHPVTRPIDGRQRVPPTARPSDGRRRVRLTCLPVVCARVCQARQLWRHEAQEAKGVAHEGEGEAAVACEQLLLRPPHEGAVGGAGETQEGEKYGGGEQPWRHAGRHWHHVRPSQTRINPT
eukprot:803194-Prorocentrum_minimum.AAC.1